MIDRYSYIVLRNPETPNHKNVISKVHTAQEAVDEAKRLAETYDDEFFIFRCVAKAYRKKMPVELETFGQS